MMKQDEFVTEKHRQTRNTFRFIGPLIVAVGVILTVIAGIDFFTLEMFEEPTYFWLFFLSIPILFVGISLCSFGYGGKVAEYQAREYAPVAKDTIQYLAKETIPAVKEISKSINSGKQSEEITCSQCDHKNKPDAKFCNGCGEKLALVCPTCNGINKADARFCDECGSRF